MILKKEGGFKMRIAFASEGKTLDSNLSFHFGRCRYYVFVNINGKEIEKVETIENPYFEDHNPGTVPQFIAKEKADVIIAGGMGPRAIDWFNNLNVQPITTSPRKIQTVLDDYISGKLSGAESCDEK